MEILLFFFSCVFLVAFIVLSMIINKKGNWIFPLIGMMWGFAFCASMFFEDPFTLADTLSGFVISTDATIPFQLLPGFLTIANFVVLIEQVRG
jgi:hypothetical protein